MVLWKCVDCSAITSEVNISNIFCNWKKWDGSFGRLANKVVFFNQPWDWFLVVFKPLIVRKLSVWKWPSGKKIILILSDFPETSHLSCSCSLCIICWTLWERSQRGILVKEQAFSKQTTTTITTKIIINDCHHYHHLNRKMFLFRRDVHKDWRG